MTFAQKRQMIVETKIAESLANLQKELAKFAAEEGEYMAIERADFLASQTEDSPEYDHNDQDGSFLNDDYCDRLDNENHD